MKASVPVFATKEWLERNALAGNGAVRECQRRTKAWLVAKAAEECAELCGGSVRKVFKAESGLHAAVVSGRVEYKCAAPSCAGDYASELDSSEPVATGSVVVPICVCDAATGVWHALVLFRRKGGEA